MESWIRLGTFVLAVAGGLIGVFGYLDAREKDAAARNKEIVIQTRESKKAFLTEQLRLYFEAAETATKIAALPDGDERDKFLSRFWQLYWGPLGIVESPAVEATMVQLGRELNSGGNRVRLQRCALNLSHAIRDSIQLEWDADLKPLAGREPPQQAGQAASPKCG